MAKNKISEWSSTPANNTDVGGIDINEGCAPSGINNAIREVMAQVKDMQAGLDGDNFTVGGNLSVTGTSTLSGAVSTSAGLTIGGNLSVTGTTTLTGNLIGVNLTANGNTVIGDNSSDTLTINATPTFNIAIPVLSGGTGATSFSSGNIILGNGTGALNTLAPSTSGNFLVSNGSSWVSKIFPAFSAYASSTQSIINDTWTKVQCNTEEFDTNSNYDTSSYKFTPTVAGYYQVTFAFEIDNNYQCAASIYKNGSSFKQSPKTANGFGSIVTALIYMNGSTDYVEPFGFVNATRTISSGANTTYFQAFLTKS